MADCYEKLTAGIALTCGNKMQAGLEDRVILMNRDDIDFDASTVNATNDKIIETIVFKSSSPAYKAYAIEGFKYSNELTNSFIKSKYSIAFDPKITVRIFDNDPDIKERVQELANSKLVLIVERVYTNASGNSKFEVYGWDAGLEVLTMETNPMDADMKGGWVIGLGANDIVKPQYSSYTLFKTDLETTRGIADALLV